MSNEQSTVTYSLEGILREIQSDLAEIKISQARLEEKVDGLSQRVETVKKRCESIEDGQKVVVNDVSDLKGAKSLIVPIVVATLTSLLTLIIRAIPNP
jgi:predicted nuclease with TOPRIM domain